MALDLELIELMHEEVILTPTIGTDKYNNILYGTPFSDGMASSGHAKCSIFRTNKRVLDVQGRETTSTVQIILADPSLAVTVDSKLELPDGSRPAILEVLSAENELGQPYYLEVRA